MGVVQRFTRRCKTNGGKVWLMFLNFGFLQKLYLVEAPKWVDKGEFLFLQYLSLMNVFKIGCPVLFNSLHRSNWTKTKSAHPKTKLKLLTQRNTAIFFWPYLSRKWPYHKTVSSFNMVTEIIKGEPSLNRLKHTSKYMTS